MRLIHGPTVTPQFPYLEDLWKFSCLMENGSNSNNMSICTWGFAGFFFFFFFDEYVWAGKFLNSRQKDFETLSWPDETSVI
jgi:hypothetical protein